MLLFTVVDVREAIALIVEWAGAPVNALQSPVHYAPVNLLFADLHV
jgi:prepilin-type processing-associated H-X9-DG protein